MSLEGSARVNQHIKTQKIAGIWTEVLFPAPKPPTTTQAIEDRFRAARAEAAERYIAEHTQPVELTPSPIEGSTKRLQERIAYQNRRLLEVMESGQLTPEWETYLGRHLSSVIPTFSNTRVEVTVTQPCEQPITTNGHVTEVEELPEFPLPLTPTTPSPARTLVPSL